MSLLRNRPRMVAAALVTAALAVPAVAFAAGNSVSIKSHHKAKVGVKFKFTVKGTSGKAGTLLSTFVNTGTKCATTYKAEAAASPPGTVPIARTLANGNFSNKYSYTPASKGKRYVCAYLWTAPSLATLAKASKKFVTK